MEGHGYTIFLGIDGVLNRRIDWEGEAYALNEKCVESFGRFCGKLQKSGGVRIILASSWRSGFLSRGNGKNTKPLRELEEKLAGHGISVTGKIPYGEGGRSGQILAFLRQHPSITPENAFIIDGNPGTFAGGPPLDAYCPSDKKGFTDADAAEILRDLKRKEKEAQRKRTRKAERQ